MAFATGNRQDIPRHAAHLTTAGFARVVPPALSRHQSNNREAALIDEKTKLLDLLSAEKEEKKALMLPADEKQKSPNWLLRNLFGAR